MICSLAPRPSVHNNHSKGHQYWKREVHHVKMGLKTLCGRKAQGWLAFEADVNTPGLCEKCKAIIQAPVKSISEDEGV